MKTLTTISGFCGLPRLRTLPAELLEMIQQYYRHSLLWRCISALQLADCVSATEPEPLLTVPLRSILSWERGDAELKLATGFPRPPRTLRLTIDSAGISKVERLAGPPMYAGDYSSRSAFIIQDKASIFKVVAQLKVCL